MRRTRSQTNKAYHALGFVRVVVTLHSRAGEHKYDWTGSAIVLMARAGIGCEGELARLIQTHPNAPVLICGPRAGVSRPGINAKSTGGTNDIRNIESIGIASTGGTRIASTGGVRIANAGGIRIANTGGIRIANSTRGIEITRDARNVSSIPDAPNSLGVASGTDGIHSSNPNEQDENLYHGSCHTSFLLGYLRSKSITLISLDTSEYFYFAEFKDSMGTGVDKNNR